MKMITLAFVLMVGWVGQVEAQSLLTAGWDTYHSKSLGVILRFPSHWQLDVEEPIQVVTSPNLLVWEESKLPYPPSPYPWFFVMKEEDTYCPRNGPDKPVYTTEGKAQVAMVCREGAEVFMGYWEDDPHKDSRKALIELMLVELRKLK